MILNLIMTLFFLTIGISYSKRFKKYEKYIFILLVTHDITLTSGLIIAFFHCTEKIQKIEVASCTISMVMVTWFRLVLRKQRKFLHKTIAVLTEDTDVKNQTHQKVMERFLVIIFFIVLSSVMIFLSPILRFVTRTTMNYNDSAIYIAPFLFKFGDVDSLMEYVTLVSIQGSMIAFNANGCWSYTIFTCYILCNLESHIENLNKKFIHMLTTSHSILKSDIKSGDHNGVKSFTFNDQSKEILYYESIMKKGFIDIIQYQQFYHRHLKNFMNFLYWTYVGTLAWILLTLILTTFAISQIPKDAFFLMKKIAISVNFLLVFYLQCYIGEAVSQLDDSLLISLYNAPWYLLPTQIRKNLITVMIQSQKQFDFNIFGMYTINLKLFTNVLKIIYSVTNILIAAQKK